MGSYVKDATHVLEGVVGDEDGAHGGDLFEAFGRVDRVANGGKFVGGADPTQEKRGRY